MIFNIYWYTLVYIYNNPRKKEEQIVVFFCLNKYFSSVCFLYFEWCYVLCYVHGHSIKQTFEPKTRQTKNIKQNGYDWKERIKKTKSSINHPKLERERAQTAFPIYTLFAHVIWFLSFIC